MTSVKRILLTPGEPAGIGPDITLQIAQQAWPMELVVIADPALLANRAKQLNLPLTLLEHDPNAEKHPHQPGSLRIMPVSLKTKCETGKLNTANASYVIETLRLAASLCSKQQADALVTGPVHKGIINAAGISFTGHTEFFAEYCGKKTTVMLFVVEQLRVALASTHLPLAKVPSAITHEHLLATLLVLQEGLKKYFHLTSPKIYVAGLNPHAGENGYLGREEIDVIIPCLTQAKNLGLNLTGPLPADTIFTEKYFKEADVILAMYHDQALPLVKYLGFGHAVNLTLGLDFLRTSVDHGTALDLAGTGQADAGSLLNALALANQCS